MSETNNDGVLTLERRGHVLLMGLNRPEKRNAFNVELLIELGRAYETLDHDDELRCGVLFAHGEHFTGGLDLAEVGQPSPKAISATPRTRAIPGAMTASRGRPRWSRRPRGGA